MNILFASTYCLLDTTSGAAVSVRTLLEQLSLRGFGCEAVTASVFDPCREVALEWVITSQGTGISSSLPYLHPLREAGERGGGLVPEGGENVVEVRAAGLRHTILRTASSQRQNLTPGAEDSLLSLVQRKIRELHPDILLTYGGHRAEKKIRALARRLSLKVVFYLANDSYRKRETFSSADAVIVPSQFFAELYRKRLGIRSHVLYPVVLKERCRSDSGVRRFVTFTNPQPQKGLTLFARVAAEARHELPEAEFVVVEGRWNRDDVLRAGIHLEKLPNVRFVPNQADMRPVYGYTKILLFPSFWEEGFGRSIVEAQLNGIPVVASRRGGIPEALNGGGCLLDIPTRLTEDYQIVPNSEEARPWVRQIRQLLHNAEAYDEACRRAYNAAEGFNPERPVEAATTLLTNLANGKQVRAGSAS